MRTSTGSWLAQSKGGLYPEVGVVGLWIKVIVISVEMA